MSKKDVRDEVEKLREEARQLGDEASASEEQSIRLGRRQLIALTLANAVEKAIETWPDEEPPPPPPPNGDLFTKMPGRLWSADERSSTEMEPDGTIRELRDAYDNRIIFKTPSNDLSSSIGWRSADLASDRPRRPLDGGMGGWLAGADAEPIRTLVVVAEWEKEPSRFAKLAGADGEGSERGGFALGATPGSRTEAWADDGNAFAAIRAPLVAGRPVLHVLRIHDQRVEFYVDGHEREIAYGRPIVPFTGPIILLAGRWKYEVVDQANAVVYAAHAYDRPISDAEVESVVEHFRDLAPPGAKPSPPPPPVTDADVTIAVAAEKAQTFSAGGFSISLSQNPYLAGKVGKNSHAFNNASFGELGANVVRFWYDYDRKKFVRAFVDTGIASIAREQGVGVFLLAPTPYNGGGRTPPTGWQTGDYTTRLGIEKAAVIVADDIRALRDQHGMVIDATGMLNEPGSGFRTDVKAEDYVFQINTFRAELDRRGLEDVKLVGLEWQPPSGRSTAYARTVAADADARTRIVGIASHTYGIGIQEADATLAREHDWEYWQTEAGGALSGSDVAARWLADVNHACTHWVFFLGPDRATSHHTLTSPGNPVNYAGHYWALKLLWNAFPPGTAIHRTSSSAEGSMRFFRADKKIYATAGRRPDGRWVVGLVNVTGNPQNEWRRFKPAEDLDVAVQLPGGEGLFDVQHVIDGDGKVVSDQPKRFIAGTALIEARAQQVVCLVQR